MPMPLQLKCPGCEELIALNGSASGAVYRCPNCGKTTRVNLIPPDSMPPAPPQNEEAVRVNLKPVPAAKPPAPPQNGDETVRVNAKPVAAKPPAPVPGEEDEADDQYQLSIEDEIPLGTKPSGRPAPRGNEDEADDDAELSIESEAPVRMKPRGGKKKKKKKKKRAAAAWLGLRPPWNYAVAGGAGVLVLIVVVILLAGGRGPDANAGGGGGGNNSSGSLAVVDTPFEGVGPTYPETERPKVAPKLPPPKVKPPIYPWNAKPDPPATAAAEIPASVNLILSGRPLLASVNGPFLTDVPTYWIKSKETPPPITVYDLRTGKAAGEFSWKAPIWRSGLLSPDGQYVVGPDAVLKDWLKDDELVVWKRDAKEPATRIKMKDSVSWMDFVAADRLAILTIGPKGPSLGVWDVVSGEQVKAHALNSEDFPATWIRGFIHVQEKHYWPSCLHGAVSPGGRYVALGGQRGIVLISWQDGEVAGLVPVPGERKRKNYRGLGFHPDGSALHVLTEAQFLSHAMADGALRSAMPVPASHYMIPPGGPTVSPVPGTVILPVRGTPYIGAGVGPENGHPHFFGGGVFHLHTACEVVPLSYFPLRWASPGRMLVYGAPREQDKAIMTEAQRQKINSIIGTTQTLYVTTFDEQTVHEKAGPVMKLIADRPAPTPADRTAMKKIQPVAPDNWAVPAAAALPALKPAAILPVWMAYNDTEAAVIIRPGHRQKVGRTFLSLIQLEWHRYDLRTGQRIGNAIPLWSWEKRLTVMPHRLPLAALSLDGKRLAMRDPNDNSRVDVWDQDGKRLAGIVPYDPKTTIDWLGWGKDGKLLTLGSGRLMGWEIEGAKAAYEVDGNYQSPGQIAPGGAWLALTGGENVDLIDAATGKCLGRCQTSKAKGGWYEHAVLSPDGKALVRMRNGRLMDLADPKRGYYMAGFVWDTTTGKLESVLDFGTSMAQGKKFIHWTSPRQFLTIMSIWHGLVDLDAKTTVCGYGMPRAFPQLKGAELERDSPIRTGPGNRLWLVSTNHTSITDSSKPWYACHRLAFPDPKGKDSAIVPGRGRYVFHRGSPVRIEVDLGSAERSKLAAGALARFLQTEGFTIGKDGWSVRLTHAVFGSGATMQGNRGGGWEIPAVDLTWQVIDPAGKVFAEKKISRHFTERPSKYQTDRQLDFATGPKVITKYNFGRQDPKKAIAEEILDWCADTGRWPPGLAPAIVEMDGNRTPLPLGSQYRIDGD